MSLNPRFFARTLQGSRHTASHTCVGYPCFFFAAMGSVSAVYALWTGAIYYAEKMQDHPLCVSDTFPLRKAEGVGRAKIPGLVYAQNPLQSSLACTDAQFFALT